LASFFILCIIINHYDYKSFFWESLMKYIFLAIFLYGMSFSVYAQDSDEVQIKGDPEVAGLVSKNVGKELPEGIGCEALT
jgi:hypothetical protein